MEYFVHFLLFVIGVLVIAFIAFGMVNAIIKTNTDALLLMFRQVKGEKQNGKETSKN